MSLLVPRISDDSLKNFFALTKIPNEEIRELRSCSVCFKRLHLIQCESRKPFHFLGYFLSPLLLSPHLMASENIFRLTGKFHRMVKSKELQMLHNLPSLYLKMFFFFQLNRKTQFQGWTKPWRSSSSNFPLQNEAQKV